MIRNELRQLAADFGSIPELVEYHCPESDHEEAVKMVRQVNAVNTYLSWMATGRARTKEGVWYGLALAAMDEVTDELQEPLTAGFMRESFRNDVETPRNEAVATAERYSRHPDFMRVLNDVAYWQDKSLSQFEDIDHERVHRITEQKGGSSGLAHLFMVKEEADDEERLFAYQFGSLMQLLDDYLDQPKDEEVGISTMFTRGCMGRENLRKFAETVMDNAEELWGRGPATRRFRWVVRAHIKLGWVENESRFSASTLVPWYV